MKNRDAADKICLYHEAWMLDYKILINPEFTAASQQLRANCVLVVDCRRSPPLRSIAFVCVRDANFKVCVIFTRGKMIVLIVCLDQTVQIDFRTERSG